MSRPWAPPEGSRRCASVWRSGRRTTRIGDRAGGTRKSRQRRNVASGVGIDDFNLALPGVRDEDAAAFCIEGAVIEFAARCVGYLDYAQGFQRHDDLMSLTHLPGCLCRMIPSMCNPLGNAERCTGLGPCSRLAG